MSLIASTRPVLRSVCWTCRRELQRQNQAASLATSSPVAAAKTKWGRHLPALPAKIEIQSGQHSNEVEEQGPRWARTPKAMQAPVRLTPKGENTDFPVNEDPRQLDEFYVNLLGRGGEDVLPEELKWLAVTHKSFDHGRRGFNERLALLGRTIVELQANLSILDGAKPASLAFQPDQYGRTPFFHPALAGVTAISEKMKNSVISPSRLARVAEKYGLSKVVRWKPRQVGALHVSGIDVVLAEALLAIIGSIATQKGGEEAALVARQKVLAPMGFM